MLNVNKQNKTLALLVALMVVAPLAAATSEAAATIEVVKAEAKKVGKTLLDAVEQRLKTVTTEEALNLLGLEGNAEAIKALDFKSKADAAVALIKSAKETKKALESAVGQLVVTDPSKPRFSQLPEDDQQAWQKAFKALGVNLEAGKPFSFTDTLKKIKSAAFDAVKQDAEKAAAINAVLADAFTITEAQPEATFNVEEVQKAVLKLVAAAETDADRKALVGKFVDADKVDAILAKGLLEEVVVDKVEESAATFFGLLKGNAFTAEFLKKCINSVSVLDDKGNVKADLKQEAAATFFKANMKTFVSDVKAKAILDGLGEAELKHLGIASGKLGELPRFYRRAAYMWQGSRPGYKYGAPAVVAATAVLAAALTGAYKLSTGFRKFIQDIIGGEQAAANDVDAAEKVAQE